MAFKKSFLLSDESINCYGFWVRTAGIDLTQAQKNLPAFYDHKTWETPVGHWVNLRVNEKGQLWGDLLIEGADDREKEYIRKIENGDIKGASIGFDPLAWNENPLQLKQGQTVPTVEQCELFEASITPLPGNKNALALKSKDGFVTLSSNNINIIPTLNITPDMKAIALKLGLSETATEQEILNKIQSLQLSATSSDNYQKQYLDSVTDGMDEETKETFVELSKTNPALAAKFLSKHKASVATEDETETTGTKETVVRLVKDKKVSELIQKGKQQLSAADAEGKDSFDYLQRKNPVELKRIHKEEPAKYAELAKGYSEGVRYTGK